jgi:hypothetical protein
MIKKASFPQKVKVEIKVLDKEGKVVEHTVRET